MLLNKQLKGFSFNLQFTALVGIVVFILLRLGDFLSYTIRQFSGLAEIPFAFASYLIIFFLLITVIQLKITTLSLTKGCWLVILSLLSFISFSLIRISLDHLSDFTDYYLILLYILYFFSGYFLGKSILFYKYKYLFFLSVILMSTTTIYLTDWNNLKFLFIDEGNNYLRLAESMVFCSLGAISYSRKYYTGMAFYLLGIVTLFIINSRFSLGLFTIIGLVILIHRFRFKAFFSLALFILLIFSTISIDFDSELLKSNRVLRLIINPQLDTSLNLRETINSLGLEDIKKNWFLGDFKGQLRYGDFGFYIHNGLSFWRQYGLIPFVSLCIGLISIWLLSINTMRKNLDNRNLIFGFSILSYTTAGLLFAKSYVYTEIFLSIGLMFVLLTSTNNKNNNEINGK